MTETAMTGCETPDQPDPAVQARKDRLVTLVGLLREAWRHLKGAIELRPDQRLQDLMDRASEIEAEAGVEILALAGNVESETPFTAESAENAEKNGSPSLVKKEEAVSSFSAVSAVSAVKSVSSPGQDLAPCDVSGVLAGGETLESGPLSIAVRGPAIEVRLRKRQTVILGRYPSGLVGFHIQTDGRDYPEIVRASAKSDGETPLVSMGQGTSRVDVLPKDMQ